MLSTEKTPLAARLEYAARGLETFPLEFKGPTKKSYKSKDRSNGRNWGKTTDPLEIESDHAKWPEAGVGLPTGVENGIFVVEADTKAGHGVDGEAAWIALEAKHGQSPDTRMAVSPTGSKHRYYKHPGKGIKVKNSASEIAPGVDVRGDGGMVVAPPTVRPGKGAYCWLNDLEIAEAPPWLLELVIEKPQPKPTGDRSQEQPPPDDDTEPKVRVNKRTLDRINKAALTKLDTWVPVLFRDAKESSGAWRVSSAALGRDLQEDISITAKGIKDFGLADMGDPQQGRRTPVELVQAWQRLKQRPAALWLAQQLKLDLQEEDSELDDDEVETINRDYALVLAGDKAAIMKFEGSTFRLLQIGAFSRWFANQRITVGERKISVADKWLVHPGRRQYEGIEFNRAVLCRVTTIFGVVLLFAHAQEIAPNSLPISAIISPAVTPTSTIGWSDGSPISHKSRMRN